MPKQGQASGGGPKVYQGLDWKAIYGDAYKMQCVYFLDGRVLITKGEVHIDFSV